MVQSPAINAPGAPIPSLSQPWGTRTGVVLLVVAGLCLLWPWAIHKFLPNPYEATATFEFLPGVVVNAEEALQATWALMPNDRALGLVMVPGKPHVYELSARLPDAAQAAARVNGAVELIAVNATRNVAAKFRLIEPGHVPTQRQLRGNPFTTAAPLAWACYFGLMAVTRFTAGRRARTFQAQPA